MARPMNPLPACSDPLVAFARDLRALRRKAGNPPLQHMSQHCGISPATLSKAQSGKHRPSWSAVVGYVTSCDGNPRQWHPRWQRLRLTAVSDTEAGHGATLERWATTGKITPPSAVASLEDLRGLLYALLRFQGLSLRALTTRAPGYSRTSYGAMLRGTRPLRPAIMKEFLAGCGVASVATLEAWFKVLVQLEPDAAFDVVRLLQKAIRGGPTAAGLRQPGAIQRIEEAVVMLSTAVTDYHGHDSARDLRDLRRAEDRLVTAYRSVIIDLYGAVRLVHCGIPDELKPHATAIRRVCLEGRGRVPRLDLLIGLALPRSQRLLRASVYQALVDADRLLSRPRIAHTGPEEMELVPIGTHDIPDSTSA